MAEKRDPDLENDEIGNTSEEAIVDSADEEFEDVDEADDADEDADEDETTDLDA